MAALRCNGEQVRDDRPPDTVPPGVLRRVHRLDLGVPRIHFLESADPEQLSVEAESEERDRGVEQPLEVVRVNVLSRC